MVSDNFVLRLCKQFNKLKRRHLSRFRSIEDTGKILDVLLTSEELLLTKSNYSQTFRNRKSLSFSFPILPLLFSISCSSISYSPVEVPSQEYTIFPVFLHCVFDTSSCCLHLFTLYCHNFPPLLSIRTFLSMHPSSPFSGRFSLIPNFTPVIIPPVAFPFSFLFFAP
jgi:hypothetical protein